MKKLVILMIVLMFMVLVSIVRARENGDEKAGSLFFFHKCDESLIGTSGYDSLGCLTIGTGPWPMFPDNGRPGKLRYSLRGSKFKFCFSERGLLPNTNYTLIYHPDLWSGYGLIHGDVDKGTSFPANYDANFNTISPSRAVGAKMWPVLSYEDDDDGGYDDEDDDGSYDDGDDDGDDD